MYKILGCFHNLQHTSNPFEFPSIPCLTPDGFVRWQTIQLLLCPDDHVPFLQRAVRVYDVPQADGGTFPKHIPPECFPTRPDEEMDKWHKNVTGKLNQDSYLRRIKNSPYQSPFHEGGPDGYFGNGRTPQTRKSSRPTRTNSQEEAARLDAYRRRSSVPDLPTPPPIGTERGSHWDASRYEARKARSHSAHRPKQGQRQRSYTAGSSPQPPSSHDHHASHSPAHRHSSNPSSLPSSSFRPGPHDYRQHRPRVSGGRPHSPSTIDETSASDGSSETSPVASRGKSKNDGRASRRNSLWPPSIFQTHKRRHSHDTAHRKRQETPPPPIPPRRPEPPNTRAPQFQPGTRNISRPHFRDNMYDPSQPPIPAPESSSSAPPPPPPPLDPRVVQHPRYPEPAPRTDAFVDLGANIGHPLTRESSDSSNERGHQQYSDWDRRPQRMVGAPIRVSTMTGVNGRSYARPEPKSAMEARRSGMGPGMATIV